MLPSVINIEVVIVNITEDVRPVLEEYPTFVNATENNSFLLNIFKGKLVANINKPEGSNPENFINKDNEPWNKVHEFVLGRDKCIEWKTLIYHVTYNTRLNEAFNFCHDDITCMSTVLRKETKDNSRAISIYIANTGTNDEILNNLLSTEGIYIRNRIDIEMDVEFIKGIANEYIRSKKIERWVKVICELKEKLKGIIGEEYLNIPLIYRVPYNVLTNFETRWKNTALESKCKLLLSMTNNYLLITDNTITELELSAREMKGYLVTHYSSVFVFSNTRLSM